MAKIYVVSIRSHYQPANLERERWHVLTTDDQEAIYRVWRATPTAHFDAIEVVATLTESDALRLGLKLNEPLRVAAP